MLLSVSARIKQLLGKVKKGVTHITLLHLDKLAQILFLFSCQLSKFFSKLMFIYRLHFLVMSAL